MTIALLITRAFCPPSDLRLQGILEGDGVGGLLAPSCPVAKEAEGLKLLATGYLAGQLRTSVIASLLHPEPQCSHLLNWQKGTWAGQFQNSDLVWSFWSEKEKRERQRRGERKGEEERRKRHSVLKGWLRFQLFFFFFFLDPNEKRFKADVVLVTCSSREWNCGVIIPH